MSGFASTKDMADKVVSFDELAPGLYAYTAEGDPNTGVIVRPDGVIIVDAQATPAMAAEVQAKIATVTDKQVRQIVLSHYHAVRVLGASGYARRRISAPDSCTATRHPGGTMVVASSCVTIAGPEKTAPAPSRSRS
jgi:glyoxylase-like metal-dependent hydrolase (beta-lactamase superfamily II)